MNDCLVMHIDNDIFKIISNEEIMQRFQNMKIHRRQLNKLTLEIFLINFYLTLFFNLDTFELKSCLCYCSYSTCNWSISTELRSCKIKATQCELGVKKNSQHEAFEREKLHFCHFLRCHMTFREK